MDNEFGMQELYFVQLKSTYPIEVKGQHFAAGEVLAVFDKIQIANFKDISREIAAQGGYHNRKLVIWDRVEGVDLVFTQGIFSPIQFGLLQNTRLLKVNDSISISEREELETNDQGIVTLKHKPSNNWIFIYNKKTGEKLTGLSRVSDTEIQTPLIYKDVVVDYQYGSPVEVRIAEKTNLKIEGTADAKKIGSTRSHVIQDAFASERVQKEWKRFVESLPTGNPLIKYTFTQSYNSLSKLLHVIQSRDMMKYISPLFEALDIPTTGKVTPKQFINLLDSNQLVKETSEDGTSDRIALWTKSQKVEILPDRTRKKVYMADGITPVFIKKAKIIKEGKWSLKTLCDLMAQKEYFSNIHSH